MKRERPSSFVRLLPWLLLAFSILILVPVTLLEEKALMDSGPETLESLQV